jgi:hypothetical protein
VRTPTPTGSMTFTVMATLAPMELEIKRERITDSVATRRAAGKDLGGTAPHLIFQIYGRRLGGVGPGLERPEGLVGRIVLGVVHGSS